MSELSRLASLSEYTQAQVEEFAALGGAAVGNAMPSFGRRGPDGEPRYFKLDVVRFLRSCRRTRPVGGLQQR